MKSVLEPEKNTADPKPHGARGSMVQIARYSQLALALPAATVAGWFFGSLIDRWLHDNWVYLFGLLLGGAGGLVELVRLASKDTS